MMGRSGACAKGCVSAPVWPLRSPSTAAVYVDPSLWPEPKAAAAATAAAPAASRSLVTVRKQHKT